MFWTAGKDCRYSKYIVIAHMFQTKLEEKQILWEARDFKFSYLIFLRVSFVPRDSNWKDRNIRRLPVWRSNIQISKVSTNVRWSYWATVLSQSNFLEAYYAEPHVNRNSMTRRGKGRRWIAPA